MNKKQKKHTYTCDKCGIAFLLSYSSAQYRKTEGLPLTICNKCFKLYNRTELKCEKCGKVEIMTAKQIADRKQKNQPLDLCYSCRASMNMSRRYSYICESCGEPFELAASSVSCRKTNNKPLTICRSCLNITPSKSYLNVKPIINKAQKDKCVNIAYRTTKEFKCKSC